MNETQPRFDERETLVGSIARLLDDARARDTIALDVHAACGFTDFLVIATVNSQGHLRGLIVQLDEFLREHDLLPFHPRRRDSEIGWVLIDLGFVVIHLMTEELRAFYELERLWFGAAALYPSSGSTSG